MMPMMPDPMMMGGMGGGMPMDPMAAPGMGPMMPPGMGAPAGPPNLLSMLQNAALPQILQVLMQALARNQQPANGQMSPMMAELAGIAGGGATMGGY